MSTILDFRSGHHPSIHLNWPLARFRHFGRICSSKEMLKRARLRFVHKILIESPIHPSLGLLIDILCGSQPPFKLKVQRVAHSWLVLPFHPVLRHAGLSSAIDFVAKGYPPEFQQHRPRISWKSGGMSLIRILQKLNRSRLAKT